MTRNFGRYKVAEELGRGAMGVVYRAVDPVIGRTVAIKAINHAYLESVGVRGEEYQARFEREAQVAGGLDHHNIVKIYDLGPDYLVMEHVEGQTLATRLRQDGPLDRETALRVVHETAAALDYAHGLGVVHRDIKPANVMLTRQGAVKVMDFGLARIESSTLTAAGEILGSAAYMAPEVIQGQPADPRSDNFALAVMAYELLTGERPFGGATVSAIIHNVVRSQPRSPRELNRKLPPEYDAIFARAFAKDPAERYSRALDFAEALASCAWGGAETATDATVRVATPLAAPEPAPAASEDDPGGQTVMMVEADEVGGADEPEAPAATSATVITGAPAPSAPPPPEPEVPATIIMKPPAPPAPAPPPAGDTSATVVSAPPPAPAEPEVAATIMMKPSAPAVPPAGDTSATVVSAPPPAPAAKAEPEVAATIMTKPPAPAAAPARAASAPPPAPKAAAPMAVPPAPPAPAPPRPVAPPAPPAAGAAPPPPASAKKGGGLLFVLGLGFGIVVLFALGVVGSWLFVRSQTSVPAPATAPTAAPEATPVPEASAATPVAEATPEAPPTPVAEASAAPPAATPPPAAAEATLEVESTPPGATVLVKGKKRGATPLRLKVPAGAVSLRVEKEGYKPWSQDLKVRAGESRTLRAQLESAATPPPTVAATPPPAPPKAAAPREGDLVPLGPDVTGPRRVKGDAAQGKRGLAGTVLIEFTVGIDGKPTDIKVVESGGVPLDEAAMKAVRSYRYEPATSHGVKVRVLQRARFTFTR